jgi:hypothetical protein
VAKLGEFFANWAIFYFVLFMYMKITELSQIWVSTLTKNGLGNILGDFFSQARQVALLGGNKYGNVTLFHEVVDVVVAEVGVGGRGIEADVASTSADRRSVSNRVDRNDDVWKK